mmetsp:Transcript_116994/g.364243  ORF Transcript_116994/g.364243 Transcript_116994/m.364243 type:complete len:282 (-) Transcript_116994:218-1063(-)
MAEAGARVESRDLGVLDGAVAIVVADGVDVAVEVADVKGATGVHGGAPVGVRQADGAVQEAREVAGHEAAVPDLGHPLPNGLASLGVEGTDGAGEPHAPGQGLRADRDDHGQALREAGALAQTRDDGLGVGGVREVPLPDRPARRQVESAEARLLVGLAALAVQVHRVHHTVAHRGKAVGEVGARGARIGRVPEAHPVPCPQVVNTPRPVLEDEGAVAGVHGHEIPEHAAGGELPELAAVPRIEASHLGGTPFRIAGGLNEHDAVANRDAGDVLAEGLGVL